MKKVLLRIFFYSLATAFFAFIFGLTVINTMGYFIKGKEIKTPDFINLSLDEARTKAYKADVRLEELLLNSEISKPEMIISQYPLPGSLIKESGNRLIKIYYTPKKSEVIMPDLSGLNIVECKNILKGKSLRWYFSFIYSDSAPLDYVISQTHIAGTKVKKSSKVGVLISKGRFITAYVMPELIGKKADMALGVFETRGINISKISYKTYEGLEPGIIINQSPRQGYKINNRSIIKLEVSE